jgi:hypothetical protein
MHGGGLRSIKPRRDSVKLPRLGARKGGGGGCTGTAIRESAKKDVDARNTRLALLPGHDGKAVEAVAKPDFPSATPARRRRSGPAETPDRARG